VCEAYAGIDVAFSKTKRLPICIAVRQGDRLMPLPLRHVPPKPPRGGGNRVALNPAAVIAFAREARAYLHAVEASEGIRIRTVAIDAPMSPKQNGIARRAAECAMDARHISCFATPSQEEFNQKIKQARDHLASGGALASVPNANQLWMLVGFALFDALAAKYECIEVFPQAIVAALDAARTHKSARPGLEAQLAAVARETGWPSGQAGEPRLSEIGYGSRHDKLDAYLAAWVASLTETEREACGEAPHDVIWIPRVRPRV
jgi:hypothetical protein